MLAIWALVSPWPLHASPHALCCCLCEALHAACSGLLICWRCAHTCSSYQCLPCCCCMLLLLHAAQILACVAVLVVAGMSLSTGQKVAQQIQHSVTVDEDKPQQGVDVVAAARQLRGMLVSGSVSIRVTNSCTWQCRYSLPADNSTLSGAPQMADVRNASCGTHCWSQCDASLVESWDAPDTYTNHARSDNHQITCMCPCALLVSAAVQAVMVVNLLLCIASE